MTLGVGKSHVLEHLTSAHLCYSLHHPHFSLYPAAALVSSFLVLDPFSSLLLCLVVHSVPVTCLLKSICFVVLLYPLPPLVPVQVFVFLLILVWLAMLSKASLAAFLTSLLPGENTCSLSSLVRMRNPPKDIFYHYWFFIIFLIMFR